MHSTASTPRSRATRTISSTAPVAFTPVMRPTQPTTNAAWRDPVQAPVVRVRSWAAEPLLERDPEPDHHELLVRRDSELDELVPHLRADRDEHVGGPRERPLHLPEERGAPRAEVALEDMPVKRVQDDRRTGAAGEEGGGASDGSRFRRVRVQDVGTFAADQLGDPQDRARVVQHGDLALELGDAHDGNPQSLGQERHRVLAPRERACDEGRVVAARLEARGEVGDVDRRPAHVEARDHPQDANLRRRTPRLTLAR